MSSRYHSELIQGDFLSALRYSEIHARYANSSYGLYHADQPLRYSEYYGYERQTMLGDLGDDIHPVRHMSYTESMIAKRLLTVQNEKGDERFEADQIMTLRMAALLHDIGECEHPEIQQATGLKVGDVPWDIKDDANSTDETAIRKYIYNQLYNDIPANVLVAADDVIDNKEGSLTRETFQAIERTGYYTTAITAGRVALGLLEKNGKEPDARTTQLSRLALRVSDNHRSFLRDASERFPYLEIVLSISNSLDKRIHDTLSQTFPEAA